MNTNMSSDKSGIIVIINGGDFTNDQRIAELFGHPAGFISDNNASPALQLLIASKNEAQRAEFEAETGWTWQAACETSIETATANLLASKSAEEIADFEEATGWKWSDAVDESILADIEARLRELSQSAEKDTNESFHDDFERETGMTYGDAVDMAAERRREIRLFGNRH
jgi:hypothetical protein